jgi:hypothetical protein
VDGKLAEDQIQRFASNGLRKEEASIFPSTSPDQCGHTFNFVGNVLLWHIPTAPPFLAGRLFLTSGAWSNAAQTNLLRFLYERSLPPYSDGVGSVRPRTGYQPSTRQDILDSIGIEPLLWDDSIAFLTAHELVREVYRHGTEEFLVLKLAPGHVVKMPVARGNDRHMRTIFRYGIERISI